MLMIPLYQSLQSKHYILGEIEKGNPSLFAELTSFYPHFNTLNITSEISTISISEHK